MNVLEIKNLKKTFTSKDTRTALVVEALKGVSFEIQPGEIFGLLGPNGAGKSTIIKSIVGMHGYEEGQILVLGHDALKDPIEAKRNIGFVPDRYSLFENLSGEQYIHYIAKLYKTPKEEMDKNLEELLSVLEMKEHFKDPISSYSHGMKQKITLIAALSHNPKLLVLDEPLTGLDPNSIFQIKQVMKNHANRGNTVFFSSHIIDLVKNLCDEVVIIKDGHLVEQAKNADLKKKHIDLEEFFLSKIGVKINDKDADKR